MSLFPAVYTRLPLLGDVPQIPAPSRPLRSPVNPAELWAVYIPFPVSSDSHAGRRGVVGSSPRGWAFSRPSSEDPGVTRSASPPPQLVAPPPEPSPAPALEAGPSAHRSRAGGGRELGSLPPARSEEGVGQAPGPTAIEMTVPPRTRGKSTSSRRLQRTPGKRDKGWCGSLKKGGDYNSLSSTLA